MGIGAFVLRLILVHLFLRLKVVLLVVEVACLRTEQFVRKQVDVYLVELYVGINLNDVA